MTTFATESISIPLNAENVAKAIKTLTTLEKVGTLKEIRVLHADAFAKAIGATKIDDVAAFYFGIRVVEMKYMPPKKAVFVDKEGKVISIFSF